MTGEGGAPSTFMIRGNLGEDYWLTEDGLYVSAFMKDGRIPSPRLPATGDTEGQTLTRLSTFDPKFYFFHVVN